MLHISKGLLRDLLLYLHMRITYYTCFKSLYRNSFSINYRKRKITSQKKYEGIAHLELPRDLIITGGFNQICWGISDKIFSYDCTNPYTYYCTNIMLTKLWMMRILHLNEKTCRNKNMSIYV